MIHLERLLKHGKLRHLDSKPLIRRLKNGVENAVRPVFGGVELIDLAFSFPVALVYTCTFISVFVFFAHSNVVSMLKTTTLSAREETPGMKCVNITKSMEGEFNADVNGHWQSDPLYLEEKSIFVLTSYGKPLSEDQFKAAMSYFKGEFKHLSSIAGNRTLAWNIAVLSSVGFKHPDTGLGLTTSTDPSYIFDLVTKTATLSNQHGVCLGLDAVPSLGLEAKYLSGIFRTEQAALTLQLPFRINASSVNGGTSRGPLPFSATFTPSVEEPCPLHGSWFRNIFFGADAEYRSGGAEIGFDIRSAMTAIAMNMGRVNMDALIMKVSDFTQSLGLIGFVDPYYDFPHFQRIYCVNKSSPMWSQYKFTDAEKKEQDNDLNANYRKMNSKFKPDAPNICLLTPETKSNQIKFYYPMITSLKWDRDNCWNNSPPKGSKSACPANTPVTKSPIMLGCKCPQDKKNMDCNRAAYVTSFYYDTNFPVSLMKGTLWNSTKDRLPKDNAFKLGIAVQQLMMNKWMKDPKIGNNYDVEAMALFGDVVATTVSVVNNPVAANNIPANQPMSSRSALTAAWSKLLSNVNNLTPGPLAPLSAIVFRSVGVYGQGHNILPINQYNLELSDVTSRNKATFWDSYAEMNLPAAACVNPFNFDGALENMTRFPPAPLIEPYYECTRNPQTSYILALGSAYSSVNILFTLLWAVTGTLMVWGWKRYLRNTDSPEAVVSHRTKRRLEGLLQELKDESLVGVVDDLLARIAALERQCGIQGGGGGRLKRGVGFSGRDEEDEDERRQAFYSLHDPKTKNDVAVAEKLGQRANKDMHQQLEKFKADTLRRLGTVTVSKTDFSTSAGTEAEEQEQEQEHGFEDEGEEQGAGEVEMGRVVTTANRAHYPTFSPTHRLHQQHLQNQLLQQQHQQQQQQRAEEPDSAHSEWDAQSLGPGDDLSLSQESFAHNPQHQHQHQLHAPKPPYSEEVSAAARRMSRRISVGAGVSLGNDGLPSKESGVAALAARKAQAAVAAAEREHGKLPPKRLSAHPISAVLSTLTPPAASSRVSVRPAHK